MDFKHKLWEIENEIKVSIAKLDATKKELKDCIAFTGKFLGICKELGIKKVAICVSHPSVKSSVDFPFGPYSSAFADSPRKYDSPVIWEAVERAGISGGCGNSDQHQLSNIGISKLVDGCYHYNGGKWKKVD